MKETSRFYSSLILLIVLNAIVKPVWIFGIDRQVQNEAGVEAYGSYFAIFNLSIVLGFLHDWGLTTFYNRQLAARDENITGNAGNFILLKLLFALIYMVIIFIVAFLSGIDRWDIVFLVSFIQVLTSLFVFFRAIITSQQWFYTDAWLSVLDKLLMIFVCFPFLYFPFLPGKMTIDRFLLLQMICTVIAMLAALGVLLIRRFNFSFKRLWPEKNVLKAAVPFAIITLLMSFHYRIDGFLLERISGAAEAGKYAGAYRLLDAANMIGYLFASFLLPFIARNRDDIKITTGVVLNVRHILLVFAITVSCIAVFLGPWIQKTLYHHDDPRYIEVLKWCLPALIGYSLVHVYGTCMTATGHIVTFSYITLVSVVINAVINILLIPSLGAKGCCLAAIISQFFCGITTMAYARQKLRVPIDIRSALIYIFIGGLVCGFLYVSKTSPMNNWLITTITGIIALIMLWLTRLIDLRTWRISARQ
jgi:O-antigen/teichoic acid export membrane protein